MYYFPSSEAAIMSERSLWGTMVNSDKATKMIQGLCDASSDGSIITVKKYLKDKILGLDLLDDNGYTALHYACEYGRSDIVELLLDHGADIEISTYYPKTLNYDCRVEAIIACRCEALESDFYEHLKTLTSDIESKVDYDFKN